MCRSLFLNTIAVPKVSGVIKTQAQLFSSESVQILKNNSGQLLLNFLVLLCVYFSFTCLNLFGYVLPSSSRLDKTLAQLLCKYIIVPKKQNIQPKRSVIGRNKLIFIPNSKPRELKQHFCYYTYFSGSCDKQISA